MSAREDIIHEHEFEAAPGLPESLPAGECILWQGAPSMRDVAERCFHIRTVTCYFAAILLLRGVFAGRQAGSLIAGAEAALWLVPPVVLALGMLGLMAYLTTRTSVYTITNRRVIMRIGIVLSMTFNLPFKRIDAADVRLTRGRIGDIALTLDAADHIAYVHLWPHARPWRVKRTQPMLRCLDGAADVGRVLATAWRESRQLPVAPSNVRSIGELGLSGRSMSGASPLGLDAAAQLATQKAA